MENFIESDKENLLESVLNKTNKLKRPRSKDSDHEEIDYHFYTKEKSNKSAVAGRLSFQERIDVNLKNKNTQITMKEVKINPVFTHKHFLVMISNYLKIPDLKNFCKCNRLINTGLEITKNLLIRINQIRKSYQFERLFIIYQSLNFFLWISGDIDLTYFVDKIINNKDWTVEDIPMIREIFSFGLVQKWMLDHPLNHKMENPDVKVLIAYLSLFQTYWKPQLIPVDLDDAVFNKVSLLSGFGRNNYLLKFNGTKGKILCTNEFTPKPSESEILESMYQIEFPIFFFTYYKVSQQDFCGILANPYKYIDYDPEKNDQAVGTFRKMIMPQTIKFDVDEIQIIWNPISTEIENPITGVKIQNHFSAECGGTTIKSQNFIPIFIRDLTKIK